MSTIAAFSAQDWQHIWDSASKQALAPYIYYRLNEFELTPSVPEEIRDVLRESTLFSLQSNVRKFQDLEGILKALNKAGIPSIPIKGAHLAALVYDDPSMRAMVDIDLLIKLDDLGDAAEIMQRQGYTPIREYDAQKDAAKHYHLPAFTKPHSTPVELHWTITYPTSRLKIDPSGLWDGAQPGTIADQPVLVLSPEDALLVLSLHLCREDFRLGLKPLIDISQVLHRYPDNIGWERLIQQVDLWGIHKCLYLTFYLLQELLGVDVPEKVLAELRPGDFNPGIAAEASSRALKNPDQPQINEYLLRLWGSDTLKGKASLLIDSIFPPKEAVALRYSLPRDSKKVYYYYGIRLVDLLKQHAEPIWGWVSRNSSMMDSIKDENALQDWLMS